MFSWVAKHSWIVAWIVTLIIIIILIYTPLQVLSLVECTTSVKSIWRSNETWKYYGLLFGLKWKSVPREARQNTKQAWPINLKARKLPPFLTLQVHVILPGINWTRFKDALINHSAMSSVVPSESPSGSLTQCWGPGVKPVSQEAGGANRVKGEAGHVVAQCVARVEERVTGEWCGVMTAPQVNILA